jgi:SAM-dependent methyltransferase
MKDFLFLHVRDLPYFRGLLRAVEATFYQDLPLPAPVLDVGCGDGHFASRTFDQPLAAGLDPWRGPIREAGKTGAYRSLVQAEGDGMPFADGSFASAVSNSVLEHIPEVQAVLAETARVLRPGAPFLFCVPNHNFLPSLSIGRLLDRLGLRSLAGLYRGFFNRISRHHHCDPPEVWQARLERAGFRLEHWWHYFPPAALAALEWGHYFGLPSLLARRLTGRWVLAPTRWNLAPVLAAVRRHYARPLSEDGAYTFFVARRC